MGMRFERLQARDQGLPGQRMGLSHYYWIKHEEREGSGETSPKSGVFLHTFYKYSYYSFENISKENWLLLKRDDPWPSIHNLEMHHKNTFELTTWFAQYM